MKKAKIICCVQKPFQAVDNKRLEQQTASPLDTCSKLNVYSKARSCDVLPRHLNANMLSLGLCPLRRPLPQSCSYVKFDRSFVFIFMVSKGVARRCSIKKLFVEFAEKRLCWSLFWPATLL